MKSKNNADLGQISWRCGSIRLVLPTAVHCIAAGAGMSVVSAQPWAWGWIGLVLVSAIYDARSLRRELGNTRTLTFFGSDIAVDGVVARVERGWLGPGWTVVWLRLPNRSRQIVSVFRREMTGADHAALRRFLRSLNFERRVPG